MLAYTIEYMPQVVNPVKAALRHEQTKRRIHDLLKEWATAGIIAMPYKGFALSEFVYPNCHQRTYSDVDILVQPKDSKQAIELAQQQGWTAIHSRLHPFLPVSSDVARLYSPDLETLIELQHHLMQTENTNARRLTEAAWAGSALKDWGRVPVRIMQPVDALLLGLFVNRAWGDEWGRNERDLEDALELIRAGNFSEQDLRERAKELRIERTLELCLKTCNPWNQTVRAGSVSRSTQLHHEWTTLFELGSPTLERGLLRLINLPWTLGDTLKLFPLVLKTLSAIKQTQDIHLLVQGLDHQTSPHPKPSLEYVYRMISAASKGLRLLGRDHRGCIPRCLSAFSYLRAKGYPVRFVTGVYYLNGKLEGHAWLELNGIPVWSKEELDNRYKKQFQYPQ